MRYIDEQKKKVLFALFATGTNIDWYGSDAPPHYPHTTFLNMSLIIKKDLDSVCTFL